MHEKMDLYYKEIRKWESNFYDIEYIHVVQDKNQAADALSKIGPGLERMLEPVPRPLRLLDWRQLRRAELVFRELGADQIKNRGHSVPKLDAVGLPGVPVLDQLVEVLLGIHLEHYKPSRRLVYKQEMERWAVKGKMDRTTLTGQLPTLAAQLLASSAPGLQRPGKLLVEPLLFSSEACNLLL